MKRNTLIRIVFLFGMFTALLLIAMIKIAIVKTSTNEFCESCHVHPKATQSWKSSPHKDNAHGVSINCVDCHLPPKEHFSFYVAKAMTGARDLYGKLFKDVDEINWDEKSKLENAVHFTYEASCKKCHTSLFPVGLSQKGEDAHLYYQRHKEVNCLNCHIRVGHFTHEEQHAEPFKVEKKKSSTIYATPAKVTEFIDYTETIPGTAVSFEMIAIPGGEFKIGSPESEPLRRDDEGPQASVKVSPFWMGKIEVTWDEYEAFYAETSREGRTDTQKATDADVDGITGPTPPYEPPDQNWGRGNRPAITMTFHAAEVYCQWLSQKTGKKYRLPTEAEWEYACRAGTNTPYFFQGDPHKFTSQGLLKKIFKPDTTTINSYVIYALNSSGRSQEPSTIKPNPFGLINLPGNVREFCSDWYAPDAYARYSGLIVDPTGPESGEEHVVRGGSYLSDAADVRCASRGRTDHTKWMMTDPQSPKSIWWYSDVKDVGFRVVCETDNSLAINKSNQRRSHEKK